MLTQLECYGASAYWLSHMKQ